MKIEFLKEDLQYDRIYEAQPNKGVCLFGGNFEPRDYSMVYCGAYFHNLYRLEPDGEGGYRGVLQNEYIENMLNRISSSGRTVVLRPVACEGGAKLDPILISLLEERGHFYHNGRNSYPCWDDELLVSYFVDFIAQLGKSYDGDPRIACVQLGLYGEFGEWNFCGVAREHFALVAMSHENQAKLVKAYCEAFHKTKLQARNPMMGDTDKFPVGFHDDNFVFNSAEYHTPEWDRMMDVCTVKDGAKEGDWYELHQFEDFFREKNLYDRWKSEMMGAEISGVMAFKDKGEYIYGNMFEGESLKALIFATTHFHMTFSLGFQRGGGGVPEKGTEQYKNFRYAASIFGYDFSLVDASLNENILSCSVKNFGIAPIYYDWDVELSLEDVNGKTVYTKKQNTALSTLLPMRRMTFDFDIDGLPEGEYKAKFRIVNPLNLDRDDSERYPLIMSNKARVGEYAVAGIIKIQK